MWACVSLWSLCECVLHVGVQYALLHHINPVVQQADQKMQICPVFAYSSSNIDLTCHTGRVICGKIFVQIWKLWKVWIKYDGTYGLSRVPFNWDLCLKQCSGRGLVLIHACEMSPPHRSTSWSYRPVSCFFLCVKDYFGVWLDRWCLWI